jgi:tetratricopeptide (TPR) repeat protein
MKLRTLLWSVALCVTTASGQTPEQIFAGANQAYQEGKLAEARDGYESVVANGYVSGELHYNLGNTYYRLGDLGRAILNYERALRLMPGDEDLRHNRQLAGLRIVDRIEETPKFFLREWWDRIAGGFSIDGATWVVFAFLCLLCAAVGLLVLARSYALRKAAFISAASAILLLLLSAVLLIDRMTVLTRSDEAVVVSPITTVKNSPDPTSTDAFVLHAGVKVQILDSINDWLRIRLPDGKAGWMERGAAETI